MMRRAGGVQFPLETSAYFEECVRVGEGAVLKTVGCKRLAGSNPVHSVSVAVGNDLSEVTRRALRNISEWLGVTLET